MPATRRKQERTCSPKPAPKKHGGERPGAGRKAKYDEPASRRGVLLPDSVVHRLRDYGEGSLSEGIVRAASLIPDR